MQHADILVLDDDSAVTRVIEKVLKKQGLSVIVANDPVATLAQLQAIQFSIIICDYKMPGMNGVDFLLRAAKVQPEALRIMLSGQADINVVQEAVNQGGVYRFLTKPWDRQQLLQIIGEGMTHVRLLNQNRELQNLVSRQNQELTTFNKNLESLVLERTEELQKTIADLERADAYKKEFIANASHELRTPMTAILGYLNLFQEGIYGEMTESQHTSFCEMQTNADILLNLINDLLNCSRLDAGKMELKKETFSITKVVNEVAKMFEGICQMKMLNFNLLLPADDFFIHTDRDLLKTVIRNLLSNAVKYTARGSISLAIETFPNKEIFSFIVVDTGCGMDPDKLDQLFQRFRTLPNHNLSSACSTGLGLALAKNLVDMMGGTITARSAIDHGTTIKFDLPFSLLHAAEDVVQDREDFIIGNEQEVIYG